MWEAECVYTTVQAFSTATTFGGPKGDAAYL